MFFNYLNGIFKKLVLIGFRINPEFFDNINVSNRIK